ncbi:MAG: hypothetical protein RLZZ568_1807 [Cyanobacteriota bacterium]|jgi:hypothetical protein
MFLSVTALVPRAPARGKLVIENTVFILSAHPPFLMPTFRYKGKLNDLAPNYRLRPGTGPHSQSVLIPKTSYLLLWIGFG